MEDIVSGVKAVVEEIRVCGNCSIATPPLGWSAIREEATSPEKAIARVYGWNERKKQFSPRQIGIAFHSLVERAECDANMAVVKASTGNGMINSIVKSIK